MNLQKNNIKRYILRRYSIDELESIFNQKLNNQSRNFKHYANMSSNKFMVIVVSSITEEILVQLTDGWVEDSPIPEEGLYKFIQEIFGERIIKKYDELTNMNLQEQTNRIKQMMGIINENKVGDIIQDMGLYDAIRYFGGYNNLTKKMGDYVLSNEDMIGFIKEVVQHLSDKYNDDGVSVWDLDMSPITIGNPDEELQQIEYFSSNGFVSINVYTDEHYNRDKGGYTEQYEDLDDNTLDEVFLFMVDALENNK
jgi:hypothetical protein